MEYTAEVLNRSTGELEEVSLGNWITVTELGERYGVGRKRVREVLHHIGLLGQEGRHGYYRLPHEFVARGFGKRFEPGKGRKYPFDTISPKAQELIDSQWAIAVQELDAEKNACPLMAEAGQAFAEFQSIRKCELATQEQVHWYLDHFPALTQPSLAELIGVSQPQISNYAHTRRKRRKFLKDQVARQADW